MYSDVSDDGLLKSSGRHVHLVGIAGSGMRSLAAVLHRQGWTVSGSDNRLRDAAQFTELPGVTLCAGHHQSHLASNVDLVIHSDAVPASNCELLSAAARGIETIRYPQMLGRLMSAGYGIAVAGTHGKSTTTAMTAEIFTQAGLDPTVIYGAQLASRASQAEDERCIEPFGSDSFSANAVTVTPKDLVLVEACEFNENFLYLHPQTAVLLNIEADHFDCFANQEAVEAAFAQFASQIHPTGKLIVCVDSPATLRAAKSTSALVSSFGFSSQATWRAEKLKQSGGYFSFELVHQGECLGAVQLSVPGKHNVSNALAAAALADAAGVTAASILAGIRAFPGLRRRLEPRGTLGGIPWVDDYAHHPSEISAALATIRQMYPSSKLWCIFEPHQASRLSALLDEFAFSLQNTDNVIVTEIFRAREGLARSGEIGPQELSARICTLGANSPDVHAAADIEELLQSAIFRHELGPEDVLVTLGAGNVERIPNGIVQRFREYSAAR